MIPSCEGYCKAEYIGKVFAVGSNKALWEVDGRKNYELCDDGIHMIEFPWGRADYVMALYRYGKVIKYYTEKDAPQVAEQGKSLNVVDCDTTYLYDAQSGSLIKKTRP